MTARLYCFGESGNAYKAALTMSLAGYDWQPVFVDFFRGETRSPDYLALNEMGEAPVLVEGDRVISQSGVMQMMVAEKTGRFMGAPEDRDEVLRWLFWDNHKGSSQFGALRFLMNFLPADKRPAEVIAWLQGRCKAALMRVIIISIPAAKFLRAGAPDRAMSAAREGKGQPKSGRSRWEGET